MANDGDAASALYRFTGDQFVLAQQLNVTKASDVTAFAIAGTPFIAFASSFGYCTYILAWDDASGLEPICGCA